MLSVSDIQLAILKSLSNKKSNFSSHHELCRYLCFFQLLYLAVLNKFILFYVSTGVAKPELNVTSTPVNAIKGRDAILQVTYSTTTGNAIIEWKFGGIFIGLMNTNTPQPSLSPGYNITDTGSLVIYNSQFKDTGDYMVSLNIFGQPTIVKHVTLNVYEPISKVSIGLLSQDIFEGTAVTLSCDVNGNWTSISWKLGNTAVLNDEIHRANGNTLMLSSISRTDAGNYTCTAQNPFNTSSGSIPVTVYYGPDQPQVTIFSDKDTNPSQFVMVNSTVILNCTTDSNPLPQYYWYLNDSQKSFQEGSLVQLNRVNLSMQGDYSCNVANAKTKISKRTSVTLRVYQLLDGKPNCQLVSTASNSALLFRCIWMGGYPPANLQFAGLENSISNNSFLEQTMTNLDGIKGKSITCVGKNVIQAENCSIIPASPSDFNYAKNVSYSDGTVTAVLQMAGNSNPAANIQWFKGNQTISNGGKYNISADTSRLTISNFTLEDDLGSYHAICQNPLGSQYVGIALTQPAVTDFTMKPNSNRTSVTLNWQVPSTAVLTSFWVQIKGPAIAQSGRAADNWYTFQILNSTTYSTVVQPLQSSQSYSFQIIPRLGNGAGTQSTVLTLSPSTDSGLTPGQIAGIVIGSILAFLLLLFLLLLIFCCLCKRKRKQEKKVVFEETAAPAKMQNNEKHSSDLTNQAATPSNMAANNVANKTSSTGRPVSMASSYWDAGSFNQNYDYDADNSSAASVNHDNSAEKSFRTATMV
ncbi:V-set and immunoglobulin domain-containing protein 10-like [Protopterus annectens]|uniref:V-set and immunoglobulin domain-containing protein 10-like n=1 Tax=Protopterus annectens TaxID=7888 RepID=UPI001CFA331C|nr:V-set and immunoglobulin domain-containing protein 10-like [Protopterus annectens]